MPWHTVMRTSRFLGFISMKRCGNILFLTHYPIHNSIDIQHFFFPVEIGCVYVPVKNYISGNERIMTGEENATLAGCGLQLSCRTEWSSGFRVWCQGRLTLIWWLNCVRHVAEAGSWKAAATVNKISIKKTNTQHAVLYFIVYQEPQPHQ